jgi:CheY-like chemotaxis protein
MKLVLLVEDEPGNAESMRAVLEAAGFRVATASNGQAALDLLAGERPAVIVADYSLPGVSGAALGRAVRADPRLVDVPFVIVSGFGQETVRDAFDDYDTFLGKPLSPEVVVPLVTHLSRYGRPASKTL